MGCVESKTEPATNDSCAATKRRTNGGAHPAPLCSTTRFWLPENFRDVAFCCDPSQTVADCRGVRKLSPSVSFCCNLSRIASYAQNFPPSKRPQISLPFPWYMRARLAENWIPETRTRLARWRAKKPDTKAGQIWALWPEIKAALDDGQSFKSIRRWLEEHAGITVSVPSLRSYISRSRRKAAALHKAEAESTFLQALVSEEPRPMTDAAVSKRRDEPERPADPMARAMRALNKSRRFDIRDIHCDGDPIGKNLI
jgi:hypothetical protein